MVFQTGKPEPAELEALRAIIASHSGIAQKRSGRVADYPGAIGCPLTLDAKEMPQPVPSLAVPRRWVDVVLVNSWMAGDPVGIEKLIRRSGAKLSGMLSDTRD
jgi:hypothetical protein